MYKYKTIRDYLVKDKKIDEDKLNYIMYYFEAWTQTIFSESFLTDKIDFNVTNSTLEITLEPNNKEETKDEDIIFIINSVLKTYGYKSKNELEALIKSEYPYIKAQKINKDNKIKKEDMVDYYSSISDIEVAKKLDK